MKNENSGHSRGISRLFCFAVVLWLLLLLISFTSFFKSLELKTFDYRFQVRRHCLQVHPDIVILSLAGSSEEDMQKKWAPYLSQVIEMLGESGAKVIANDIYMGGSYDSDFPRLDKRIEQVLSRSPVILTARPAGTDREINWPYAPFLEAAGQENIGIDCIAAENGQVVRSAPLYYTEKKGIRYPAFTLIAAARYMGVNPDLQKSKTYLGKKAVPEVDNKLLINYAGPVGTFNTIPFYRVCEKTMDGKSLKEKFEGKIVFLGTAASNEGNSFYTPFSGEQNQPMSAVEIAANCVNTIIQDRYIKRPGTVSLALILLLLCLWAGFISHTFKMAKGIIFTLGLTGSYLYLCFFLFEYQQIWLDIVIPCLAVPLVYGITLAYQFRMPYVEAGKEGASEGDAMSAARGKAEVFISYSRKDKAAVLKMVKALQQEGITTWIDAGGIDGALPWSQQIVEAIERCKVLILMASEASFQSHNIVKEVTLASTSRKHILPIYLEPAVVPKSLRYQLAGIQHIDLFKGDRQEKLQAISRSLARLGVKTSQDGGAPPESPQDPQQEAPQEALQESPKPPQEPKEASPDEKKED